jgi:hypothetical protein
MTREEILARIRWLEGLLRRLERAYPPSNGTKH